jgi:hypothetical protein
MLEFHQRLALTHTGSRSASASRLSSHSHGFLQCERVKAWLLSKFPEGAQMRDHAGLRPFEKRKKNRPHLSRAPSVIGELIPLFKPKEAQPLSQLDIRSI